MTTSACGRSWTNELPEQRHAAALIGPGSEVLGSDDETSTDHHWGPRVQLFLEPADHLGQSLSEVLAERLPHRHRGWPTSWTDSTPEDPAPDSSIRENTDRCGIASTC